IELSIPLCLHTHTKLHPSASSDWLSTDKDLIADAYRQIFQKEFPTAGEVTCCEREALLPNRPQLHPDLSTKYIQEKLSIIQVEAEKLGHL
ncbi:hypothetical protein FQA47_014082, partial [Oryzias melastigma]